jgi:hypothetical protein
VRPTVWLAPVRTGTWEATNLVVPAIDVGVWLHPDRSAKERLVYGVGVRAEYDGDHHDGARGIGWGLFVTVGYSITLVVPR